MQYRFNEDRGLESYNTLLGIDILSILKSIYEGGKVPHWIDIGCGRGRCIEEVISAMEQEKVPLKVSAVDSRQVRSPIFKKINFEKIRAEKLDKTNLYDLATAVFVLPYNNDPVNCIEKIYNSLTEGGMAAMTLFRESVRTNGDYIGSRVCPVRVAVEETGGSMLTLHNPAVIQLVKGSRQVISNVHLVSSRIPPERYPIQVEYSFSGTQAH